MANDDERKRFNIYVHPSAKAVISDWKHRAKGTPEQAIFSSIVEWFAVQSEDAQRAILGLNSPDRIAVAVTVWTDQTADQRAAAVEKLAHDALSSAAPPAPNPRTAEANRHQAPKARR